MHADLDERLLALLADGNFHSGVDLAERLGVSRGTVWQHVHALVERQLDVYVVRGKGYRLSPTVELLDQDKIRAALSGFARLALIRTEILNSTASTNAWLFEAPAPLPGRFVACLAEYQTQGKGRRGRVWQSPFASGLCLSLACQFDARHAHMSTLSLAVGVAVRRALVAAGVPGVQLKWPNDLIVEDRKLGGVLVQMHGEAAGPAHLVIGIGINVTASPEGLDGGLPPIHVHEAAPLAPPGRNALAGALLSHVTSSVDEFGRSGFAPFVDEWRKWDYLDGRRVRIDGGVLRVSGIAAGVTGDGALRVKTGERIREFVSGEVSVRPN